jgi:hypothetical protein
VLSQPAAFGRRLHRVLNHSTRDSCVFHQPARSAERISRLRRKKVIVCEGYGDYLLRIIAKERYGSAWSLFAARSLPVQKNLALFGVILRYGLQERISAVKAAVGASCTALQFALS